MNDNLQPDALQEFLAAEDDIAALQAKQNSIKLPDRPGKPGLPSMGRISQKEFTDDRESIKYVNKLIENAISSRQRGVEEPIITSEILMKAPSYFLNQYDTIVAKAVPAVQTLLTENEKSRMIADVQADPTDEKLKEAAVATIITQIEVFMLKNPAPMKNFDDTARHIITELVTNEIIGLGPLEPLWQDKQITEIIANGPRDIQVEILGNIHKVSACHFRDQEHLQDLISRLFAAINKDITPTNPMEKGRLRDNSRMMAVHKIVAPSGPNFNIRRHSEKYWSAADIIAKDTANVELMTYLGNLIYSGISFLVIGGTGSGKTTLLNSLTGFFREDARLVTLEENLELKPHPNKLFAAAMECIPPKPGSISAGVNMRDLVHASLQMRPEGIIIGEVTDHAAYDLCQALNTGHWGASTIHANSPSEAAYRMMSLVSQSDLVKGESAYNLIASAFDIIIAVERFPFDGSRKIVEVAEVGEKPTLKDDGNYTLDVIPLWKYYPNPMNMNAEERVVSGHWKQLNELSLYRRTGRNLDLMDKRTWADLKNISSI